MKRLGSLLSLFLISLAFMGANESIDARFNSIGHKMVCICSCNQILLECNHVGCPNSSTMIDELHQQLAGGGGDTSIFNWFAAKYGPIVLASPMRGGFDMVAWIVPVSIALLALIATIFLAQRWKKRATPAVIGDLPSTHDAVRDRIRRETEY